MRPPVLSLASPSTADSVRAVTGIGRRASGWLPGFVTVVGGAAVLRAIAGVGFANYDTLYALAWGGQLAQGETPAYGQPLAPTPHPLLELFGIVLRPLSPHAEIEVVVWLGYLALAGCGWLLFRLGQHWFGTAAGVLAALLFVTRVPVISYGVRAYLDVPYVLFVLWALLIAVRRPRAGAPVLALLGLAGLLRPEAWVFSGLYWLFLVGLVPGRLRAHLPAGEPVRGRGPLVKLTLLAAAAPLLWLGSDLLVTGNPLLVTDQHASHRLDARPQDRDRQRPRVRAEADRRGAAGGGARRRALIGAVLTLWWLRARALVPALGAALAVAIFAAFAAVGLPINTRYAFLAAAFGCLFFGAAVFGWTELRDGRPAAAPVDRGRGAGRARVRRDGAIAVPQAHHELRQTRRTQERIEGDLEALVGVGCRSVCAAARSGSRTMRRSRCSPSTCARVPRGYGAPQVGPHRLGRLRRSGRRRGRTRIHARRARPPRGGLGPARLHALREQPLLADLPSLSVTSRERFKPSRGRWRTPQTRISQSKKSGPCTPRRESVTGRLIAILGSGPGAPAAPAGYRLRLLPSGPDLIREPSPRGTRTIDAPGLRSDRGGIPRRGVQPR